MPNTELPLNRLHFNVWLHSCFAYSVLPTYRTMTMFSTRSTIANRKVSAEFCMQLLSFQTHWMDDITVAIRIEVHLNPLICQLIRNGCYWYSWIATATATAAIASNISITFSGLLVATITIYIAHHPNKSCKRSVCLNESNLQMQLPYIINCSLQQTDEACNDDDDAIEDPPANFPLPTMLIWKLIWMAAGEKYHFNISNRRNVSVFLSFSTIILNSQRISFT